MKCAHIVVVIAAILLLGGCARGAVEPIRIRRPVYIPADKVLTLEESINLALQSQASIRLAQAQVLSQTGNVSIADSALYPTTTAATATQLVGGVGNGRTQILFGVNQLIYNFGKSSELLRQARQQRAASLQSLSGTTEDVVLNVKQAYYTLLQDIHLVDVFTTNVAQQQAHLAQTQAQEEAGVVPHTNVLQAETAVASAQVDLVTAQNLSAQARINLSIAMGIDVRSPLHIAEESEPDAPIPTEDAAIALAHTRRPELLRDRDQITAAQAGLKAARAGYQPSIIAGATFTPNPGATGIGQQQAFALSLNLTLAIFDFGAIGGTVQQARAQVSTAQETFYNDQQTVDSEVEQARLNIQAAQAKETLALAEVASAQANVNAAVGSYQAGTGIFLAVIDAQQALVKAQVDEFTARYGLSIARAMLQHATGGAIPYGRALVGYANTLK